MHVNEPIGIAKDCNVPILLGVDNAYQYNRFCDDTWRTGIFLVNVCRLFVVSSYFPRIDPDILLLFEKHMRLQHHLEFFICQITPVHRDKDFVKV